MSLPRRPFRPPLAILALLTLLSTIADAAEIYVLDARIERDGRSSLAPTFIVTPGERALMVFEGEADIDVAMTVMPKAASGGAGAESFDVRVEVIDGMEVFDEVLEVALSRPANVQLGEREIVVLVRVQEPLAEEAASGSDARGTETGSGSGERGTAAETGDQGTASGSGGQETTTGTDDRGTASGSDDG